MSEIKMTEERANELSQIWRKICMTGSIPWITEYPTKELREKYLAETYNGATLNELLSIGIDPFM